MVLDFYEFTPSEGGKTRSVLQEAEELLTPEQMLQLMRQLSRIEEHGSKVGPKYFGKVVAKGRAAERLGIRELRHSLQDIEFRFLYVLEDGVAAILAAYVEKRDDIPQGMVDRAVERFPKWQAKRRSSSSTVNRDETSRVSRKETGRGPGVRQGGRRSSGG
jgi:hypothetical protein